MASANNVPRSILPEKRRVDDADDCDLEEYRKPKMVVSKYPPPKMRTGVQVVRDFPPACGVKEESLLMKVRRNPLNNVSNFDSRLKVDSRSFQDHKLENFKPKEDSLKITAERNRSKNLDNADSKLGRITSHGTDKLVHSGPFEHNELKSLKPKGLGRNNSFAARPPGKVKFWDPTEKGGARKLKVTTTFAHGRSRPSDIKKLISCKPQELGRNNPSLASRPAGSVKCLDPNRSKKGDARKANVSPIVVSRPSDTKEVGRHNPSFASRPIGKVKFRSPNEGDAKNPKVTTMVTVVPRPSEKDKLISSKLKEMRRYNSSFGSRPAGKVKFWDPNCREEGDAQKSKDNTIVPFSKEEIRREEIKKAMTMFDKYNRELYELNRSRPKGEQMAHWRVPIETAKKVKQMLKWMDAKKTLGSIRGIWIGDKFRYRSQLKMIGLHCQMQSGIDYTMIEGRNLAISIVDAHRYSNQRQSCDELYYSGHGGNVILGKSRLPPEDQKLERGNLALKNSMIEKTPVRVIRKLQGVGNKEVFVYDGLYVVEDYTRKKGEQGKMVFMFKLRRKCEQPQLHQMLNGGGSIICR